MPKSLESIATALGADKVFVMRGCWLWLMVRASAGKGIAGFA